MNAFFTRILGLLKREPDLVTFMRSKSDELKAVEKAVVDAVVAAQGGPVDLIEIYNGLAAAKRLFAERQDFVNAFEHFIKG